MNVCENRLRPFPLLLALTSFAVLLCGCSKYSAKSEYQQWQERKKDFTDSITAMGAKAEEKFFKMYGKEGMAWVIDVNGGQITDGFIESLAALDNRYIAEINFSKSSITDQQLLRFDELTCGRVVLNLDLSDTQISDAALTNLKNFYCLNKLNVKGSKITPEGVEQFKKNQESNPLVQAPFKKPEVEL